MSVLHAQTSSDRDLIDIVLTYKSRLQALHDEMRPYEVELENRIREAGGKAIEADVGKAYLMDPWTGSHRTTSPWADLVIERTKSKEEAL